METGATDREALKGSFDLLASVDMMRFDVQRFGHVLPETRQRVYDEELSNMAEGVNRAAKTDFTLHREGSDLVYFDEGQWRPYAGMLTTGMNVAKREAEDDPRKLFLLDWAGRDLKKGYQMQALKPGQQMVWHNSYPFEVEQLYGRKFLRDCGLFPDRQMGFIYRATCDGDGNVTLESQTVDRSDSDGLAAVEQFASDHPDADMNDLTNAYDNVLENKHGKKFYAGRSEAEVGENAWNEILRHRDLTGYFLDGLEDLAQSELPRSELEGRVKRHVIGCWKAFKERLDGRIQPLFVEQTAQTTMGRAAVVQDRLAKEVEMSFQLALRSGDIKTGCGGSISASDELGVADGLATFSAIFGGESNGRDDEESDDSDEHGPLEFECTAGCKNRRPRGQLISECKNKKHGCKGSVGC